jgi:hypothetical protein
MKKKPAKKRQFCNTIITVQLLCDAKDKEAIINKIEELINQPGMVGSTETCEDETLTENQARAQMRDMGLGDRLSILNLKAVPNSR